MNRMWIKKNVDKKNLIDSPIETDRTMSMTASPKASQRALVNLKKMEK
jgi:hypothetical protein